MSTEFSRRAVNRAVLRESLQKPSVLYPAAIGLLGGLATAVIGPATVFVVPAIAGTAIGLGSWAWSCTLGRERHAARYLRELQQRLAGRLDEAMMNLKAQFVELGFDPGRSQLANLRNKFGAFEQLLRSRLDPRELTYARYLGMTEQVFLGGVDNLQRVADILKGLSAMDVRYIDRRIRELETDGIESVAQDQEIAALRARLELRDERQERVFALLAENEAAMTQIDKVMAAIAELDTAGRHSAMKLEHAMAELEDLAGRAAGYAAQAGS